MLPLWQRLPVIIRAVLTGLIVAAAGTTPWAILVKANQIHHPDIPWAVLPTVLYLWPFWRYVKGEWWPRSTAAARRTSCRNNPVPAEVWGPALFAGGLGLVALVFLMNVMNRLVRLPAQQMGDLSHVSSFTLLGWLLMSAIVAGIAEETAFRGYMQGPIERRHGPVIAILVTGSLFGLAHFSHPEVGLVLLPYYLAVATIYGALAYLTNSIWPGAILHATGNVLGSLDLLARGQAEWQASPSPAPLIWQSGPDARFLVACLLFLIATLAAVWAYAMLADVARKHSGSAPLQPMTPAAVRGTEL
jgi:membrane protease YdiL (CAAX protease family)